MFRVFNGLNPAALIPSTTPPIPPKTKTKNKTKEEKRNLESMKQKTAVTITTILS